MSAGDLVSGEIKHTATPWQSGGCVVWQAGGNAVADLSMSGKSPDQIEANAEFIVRAVNAHDDLVAALRAIQCYPFMPFLERDALIHAALRKAGVK